jgi:hypothetical protein
MGGFSNANFVVCLYPLIKNMISICSNIFWSLKNNMKFHTVVQNIQKKGQNLWCLHYKYNWPDSGMDSIQSYEN